MESRKILPILALVLLVVAAFAVYRAFIWSEERVAEGPRPTPTPKLADLTMTGYVYDPDGRGVSGANVDLHTCYPRVFRATTDATGAYTLTVKGDQLYCDTFTIQALMANYEPRSEVVTDDALFAQPRRNFKFSRR